MPVSQHSFEYVHSVNDIIVVFYLGLKPKAHYSHSPIHHKHTPMHTHIHTPLSYNGTNLYPPGAMLGLTKRHVDIWAASAGTEVDCPTSALNSACIYTPS